jgi:hypothetical protein
MYIRTYKCVIDWVKPVGLHKIPYTNDHSIIEAVLRGKHLTQHYLAEMAFKLLGHLKAPCIYIYICIYVYTYKLIVVSNDTARIRTYKCAKPWSPMQCPT